MRNNLTTFIPSAAFLVAVMCFVIYNNKTL